MSESDSFADLLRRVRARDANAATELVRQYEPQLRRKVRVWMRMYHPELRRLLDSADICQSVLATFLAPGPTPSQVIAGQELLHQVQERLSAEEQRLAELRSQGRSWAEIAVEMGGSADGRRMQLTRTLDRVARALNLAPGSG
jgi:hypothetical protein